jgi:hypothetical protein
MWPFIRVSVGRRVTGGGREGRGAWVAPGRRSWAGGGESGKHAPAWASWRKFPTVATGTNPSNHGRRFPSKNFQAMQEAPADAITFDLTSSCSRYSYGPGDDVGEERIAIYVLV